MLSADQGSDQASDAPPVLAEGVSVVLGGRPVLRGVDLRVDPGDFVALLGANGSGKSTLVRALTGLRPLAAGRIRLYGTPVRSFRDWGRVGFVPQRASAAGGVPSSVWEVVASGRLTHRRLFRPLSRADRTAVAEAIEVVGLGDLVGRGVSQLSGGQQQRVLIARALAGQPDLFVLDEPTAGVDLHHQATLADTLGLLKSRGATIVLVAHELGPMATLIDRSVVLRDGRVAYDGPPLSERAVHAHHLDHLDGTRHVEDHAPHVGSPFDGMPHDHSAESPR